MNVPDLLELRDDALTVWVKDGLRLGENPAWEEVSDAGN